MSSRRILIVADDSAARAELEGALSSRAEAVETVESLDDAIRSAAGVNLVVLDASSFPAAGPAGAFRALRDGRIGAPCLVTLRDASVAAAVDLMRAGAFSVASLPVDVERFAFQVDHALQHADLAESRATLESRLESQERLAMIGKLAAGVAHELNNPLDGVLRFVNLTVDALPKDSPEVPYLLEARRGLRRMADIVRDLLQFSRHAGVDLVTEDCERLAREAVAQAVAQAVHREIRCAYSFPAAPVAMPRAMFQVFANLAKNAVDAMPQGGSLTVAARLANGRVLVELTDTGTGIPPEILGRIFEPFFTTKEVGRGTGLGLSISARIVERLGGALTIESEPGVGTRAVIDVPSRQQSAAARATSSAAALAASGGVF